MVNTSCRHYHSCFHQKPLPFHNHTSVCSWSSPWGHRASTGDEGPRCSQLGSEQKQRGQRRLEAPEKDVLTDGEGGERLDDLIRIASDLFLLLLERRYNGEDRLVLCYLGDERGTRACSVKWGRAHLHMCFMSFLFLQDVLWKSARTVVHFYLFELYRAYVICV